MLGEATLPAGARSGSRRVGDEGKAMASFHVWKELFCNMLWLFLMLEIEENERLGKHSPDIRCHDNWRLVLIRPKSRSEVRFDSS
jgi:hypothetical protein